MSTDFYNLNGILEDIHVGNIKNYSKYKIKIVILWTKSVYGLTEGYSLEVLLTKD